MTPAVSLRQALSDPNLLGDALPGDSWKAWRVLLIAAMGEPLTDDERPLFKELTGRDHEPGVRVEELWGVVGRRGGKSNAIATLAVYLSCLCDYRDVLVRGETGLVLCVAPDQRQARIVLDYASGVIRSKPMLERKIVKDSPDTLELDNGITIEVRSASFRRLRGPTCVAVIGDEVAYWLADDSANPDAEILNAVRPALATTRGPLLCISSPYARKGEMWTTYTRHFGAKGDPKILVAQGASRMFNPSLPQEVVDRAYARDAAKASAEYGALFRSDLESFVNVDLVNACVQRGVTERLPDRRHRYVAFTDPSGGSADSFTLAIAHTEGPANARTAILDLVRERTPPFSPEQVVEEFADICKNYRVTRVFGDAYGGEFPRELFLKHSISYAVSDKSRSELYLALLPLINSRAVDLLDHTKLLTQLCSLDRRTSRAGRDSVDHPPGSHDDAANAAAGAIVTAWKNTSSSTRTEFETRPRVILGHQNFRRRHTPSTPLNYDPSGAPPWRH